MELARPKHMGHLSTGAMLAWRRVSVSTILSLQLARLGQGRWGGEIPREAELLMVLGVFSLF